MKTVLTRFLALALLWTLSAASADAACWQWSKTAASNATADPSINWAEGMAPSSVNNSARAMMARLAECRDDLSGLLLSTGTSTAYAVTSNQGTIASTPGDGQGLTFRPNVTNGASPTLAVDGGTAYPIQSSPGTAVASGVLVQGTPYRVTFSTSSNAWLLNDFYNTTVAAGSIVTSMLADSAVTYAKIQNVTNNRILGNFSGGAAAPSEYAVANASVSGSTISMPFAPPGASFKNLVIKVASNTTATVTADYVVTTDGTNYQTTAVSCTINFGTTGINALDNGTVATSSWYAIWVMVKTDSTTGCTASLQGTANATFLSNRPSGYTFYGRVGWLRTDSSVAQLMGTWQFGKTARYILGLAKTSTTLPVIDSGNKGGYSNTSPTWTTASVSSVIPTTASAAIILATNTYNNLNEADIMLAPNNSYLGPDSLKPPLFHNNIATINVQGRFSSIVSVLLESANVYWASDGPGAALLAYGWEDNL